MGCNKKHCSSSKKEKVGNVRVVHNIPGAPNVDVYLSKKRSTKQMKVLSDVAYKQVSSYLTIPVGSYDVVITATNSTSPLIQKRVRVFQEAFSTLIAVGDASVASSLNLLDVEDDERSSKNRRGKLRFIHGAAQAPNVDVYVDKNPVLRNVSYKSVSDYLQLKAPELYNVEVFVADTKQRVIEKMIFLENKQNISLLASGIPESTATPLTSITLVDNDKACIKCM